jgi:5-methylcytosine-specific restriction endonuclease McrA
MSSPEISGPKMTATCYYCGIEFVPRDPEQVGCFDRGCRLARAEEEEERRLATGGCPDCRGYYGRHTEVCKQIVLETIGLPQGPCPWCSGHPGRHAHGCELVRFVRQDGVCPLCGRPLDPKIAQPDPDHVNHDHIWPRSLARGEERPFNLALAHYRCNQWKGNNPAPFGQPPWGILVEVPKIEKPENLI